MSALFREYLSHHRLAVQSDELRAALAACGLRQDKSGPFGVAFVVVDSDYYEPEPTGKAAIVIPVFEGGALVDLVACGLQTRASRTRTGDATVLGREWIDRARENETALLLFADPIEWLRNKRRGVVVIDWRAARHALADVPAIACSSTLLAKRVDNALRKPMQMPKLFIREEAAHAAP